MVDHPVTSAFLATIRACAWVAPDHVQLIVGPPLWIHVSDQGDGHWSFGAQDGSVAIDGSVFSILGVSTANADGTFTRADGVTVKQLVPSNGQVTIDEPPDAPPPPPPH